MHEEAPKSSQVSLWPRLVAAGLVFGGLVPVQLQVHPAGILIERFVPGAGWAMMVLLSAYAFFLAGRMLDPRLSALWRRRVWALFSLAFYLQLLIGLAGVEQFLMSGKLHFPIPALIAAGPAYREAGWFMPTLFAVSVLLLGPAWCSHLCYQGAWDHAFSRRRKKPVPLPGWTRVVRLLSPLLVMVVAFTLGWFGVSWVLAGGLALAFGMLGVMVMGLLSSRTGQMVHCLTYCPMGAIASLLGKLNPFRMRIADGCDQCGSCTLVCRYNAVNPADLERQRVALSCTLCGDCIKACRKGQMRYWLPGLGPQAARTTFVVMAVTLHGIFLGVAMI
jgi:polyferredoxin